MKIPILSGIYADIENGFRMSLPVNLEPVVLNTGLSEGHIQVCEGVSIFVETAGLDRGGINWKDECYRVIGENLYKVSSTGVLTDYGVVGGSNRVVMDYSFDRLAIVSNGNLFYLKDDVLSQVTDPDLGVVIDVVFIDGYFVLTDGVSLIVTELNDPTQINPFKYGSSEVDPDNIVAIKKLLNELVVVNRHTIEIFTNIGGTLFPFQRVESAVINIGCVGTHACINYLNSLVLVGSVKNAEVGVYFIVNNSYKKLSIPEIDLKLNKLSVDELNKIVIETRFTRGEDLLYIHLPTKTYVYSNFVSTQLGNPVWHIVSSGESYTTRNFVYCYGKWIVGDITANRLGVMSRLLGRQYGAVVDLEFYTQFIYNEGRSVIVHSIELVGRNNTSETDKGYIGLSWSDDGESFSQEEFILTDPYKSDKRLVWFRQGMFRHKRLYRIRSRSDTRLSVQRLEANVEALMV